MRNATYCRPVLLPDERLKANLEKLEKQKLFREALDLQVKEASSLKNSAVGKGRMYSSQRRRDVVPSETKSGDISPMLSSSTVKQSQLLSPPLNGLSPQSSFPPPPPPLPPAYLFSKTPTSACPGGALIPGSPGTEISPSPITMRYRFSFEDGKGQFYPSPERDITTGIGPPCGTSSSGSSTNYHNNNPHHPNGSSLGLPPPPPPPTYSPPFLPASSDRASLFHSSSMDESPSSSGNLNLISPIMNATNTSQHHPSSQNTSSLAGSAIYPLPSTPHSPLPAPVGDASSSFSPHHTNSPMPSVGDEVSSGRQAGGMNAGSFSLSPVIPGGGGGGDTAHLGSSLAGPLERSPKTHSHSATNSPMLYLSLRNGQNGLLSPEGSLGSPMLMMTGDSRSSRNPSDFESASVHAEGGKVNGVGVGGGSSVTASGTTIASSRHLKTGAPKKQQTRHLPPLDGVSGNGTDMTHSSAYPAVQARSGSSSSSSTSKKAVGGGLAGGGGGGGGNPFFLPPRSSLSSTSSTAHSPTNALLTPIISKAGQSSFTEDQWSLSNSIPNQNGGEGGGGSSNTCNSSCPPTPQEQALMDEMKMKERSWEEQVERLKEELRQARQEQQQKQQGNHSLYSRRKILKDVSQLPRSAEVPSLWGSKARSMKKGLRKTTKEESGARGLSRGKGNNNNNNSSMKGSVEETGNTGDSKVRGAGEEGNTGDQRVGLRKKEDEEDDKLWFRNAEGERMDSTAENDMDDRAALLYGATRRAETAPEGGIPTDMRSKRRSDAAFFPTRARYGHGGRRAPLSPPNPDFSRAQIFDSSTFHPVNSPPLVDPPIQGEYMVPHEEDAKNNSYRGEKGFVGGNEGFKDARGGEVGVGEETQRESSTTQKMKKMPTTSKTGQRREGKASVKEEEAEEEGTPNVERKKRKSGSEGRKRPDSTNLGSTLLQHLGVDSSFTSNSEDGNDTAVISFEHLLQFVEGEIITHQQSVQLWSFFMSSAVRPKSGAAEQSPSPQHHREEEGRTTMRSNDQEEGHEKDDFSFSEGSSIHAEIEGDGQKGRSHHRMSVDNTGEGKRGPGSKIAIDLDDLLETEIPSVPPSEGTTPSLLFEYSMSSSSQESDNADLPRHFVSDNGLNTSSASTRTEKDATKRKSSLQKKSSLSPGPSSFIQSKGFPQDLHHQHHLNDLLLQNRGHQNDDVVSTETSTIDISLDPSTEDDTESSSLLRAITTKGTPPRKQITKAQPEATLHHPALLNIMSASLRKKIIGTQPEKSLQSGIKDIAPPSFSTANQVGTVSLKGKPRSNTRKPIASKPRKEKKKKTNYQFSYIEKLLFASDDDLA